MSAMPDKALQDALTYACERGRYEGGWPLIRPRLLCIKTPVAPEPSGLHLNGDGLAGLERDAIRIALHDCHGNATLAARRLKIKRSTIYDKIKRLGVFAPLVLLLVSCAPRITRMNADTKPSISKVPQAMTPPPPMITEARGLAIINPPPSARTNITLVWENAPGASVTDIWRVQLTPFSRSLLCSMSNGVEQVTLRITNEIGFYQASHRYRPALAGTNVIGWLPD
jgi:hypothetical protein